jgi:hypothetical protein
MSDRLVLNSAGRTADPPEVAGAPSQTDPNGTPAANGTPADHDARGRWTAGNKAAVGRPFARRVAKVRTAILDFVTPARLEELLQRMLRKALAGHVGAARLLLEYAAGKPATALDVDDLDAAELRQLLDAPDVLTVVRGGGRIAPAVALEILADSLATDREGYARAWAATVARMQAELESLKKDKARLQGRLDEDDDDDLTDLDDGEGDPPPDDPRGAA